MHTHQVLVEFLEGYRFPVDGSDGGLAVDAGQALPMGDQGKKQTRDGDSSDNFVFQHFDPILLY